MAVQNCQKKAVVKPEVKEVKEVKAEVLETEEKEESDHVEVEVAPEKPKRKTKKSTKPEAAGSHSPIVRNSSRLAQLFSESPFLAR